MEGGQLKGEESQGCLPLLQELWHSTRGYSEEDHGQPWRAIAEPQTVGQGEFEPEEANRDNLKSIFENTWSAEEISEDRKQQTWFLSLERE